MFKVFKNVRHKVFDIDICSGHANKLSLVITRQGY